MDISKKLFFIPLLSVIVIFLITSVILPNHRSQNSYLEQRPSYPTPTPFNPFPYKPPNVEYSRSYLTMIVGDSIVGSLGPNAQLLRQHLIELYPDHEFVNYNYGFGATSIETLPDRLKTDTVYEGQNYPAILSQGFDLIIIESFSYNPLSQLHDGEGIAKHINILDESIRQIIRAKPKSVVAIMTPIAPNKKYFAKGVYRLSEKERVQWVEERISYIETVVKYAKEKEIPLIDVFEKSLTPEGTGNLKYINRDDYIHPSVEGVDLISKTIAEFIFTNKIFPY